MIDSVRLKAEIPGASRPWREVFAELRPDDAIPSTILRGSRNKEEMQLSEMTGIPRRHISEMEHGKRPICSCSPLKQYSNRRK